MTDIKARVDEFFAEMDASPALEREVFDRIKRRIDKRLDDLDRMDRLADQRMDRLNVDSSTWSATCRGPLS